MDLPHLLWVKYYLTYNEGIVGFSTKKENKRDLVKLSGWLDKYKKPVQAYISIISPRFLIRKATAIDAHSIYSIPYPENGDLNLSDNEEILVDDIVDFYRDFVRFGEDKNKPKLTHASTKQELNAYNTVLTKQINGIYYENPLRSVSYYRWPGVICQSYVFGNGAVDWTGAEELKSKLDNLLHEQVGSSLHVTRVARIYDGHFIHILKPEGIRYWLKSIALQDSDEIISDLRSQGF